MEPSNRSPRVPFEHEVFVALPEVPDQGERLYAQNLSQGGIFIKTAYPPKPGSRVMVALEAEGRFLPLANGEVVWEKPLSGFGVRFLEYKTNGKALVERLVRQGGKVPRPAWFASPTLTVKPIAPPKAEPRPVVSAAHPAPRSSRPTWETHPAFSWVLPAVTFVVGLLIGALLMLVLR